MTTRAIFALMLPLATLPSACGTVERVRLADESNPAPCPNAFVLQDAARLIEFDGEPSLGAVAWSAEVTDVRTSCRYAEDAPIRARVELDLAVGRGPAAEGEDYEVTYFVAVTRRDRDLIAKESFAVPVSIAQGVGTARRTETVREIVIPRAGEGTSGTNFEIAVGLALTPEQVLYNRSGRSLKFPEL